MMRFSFLKRSLFGLILWACVLPLVVAGCSGDSGMTGPGLGAPLTLSVRLETPTLATRIRTVTLTVQYGASVTPDRPDTLNYADGVINDTVEVAAGDSVTFILRALDEGGVPLYEGTRGPLNVHAGVRLELDFLLEPVALMLRVSPIYQEATLATAVLLNVNVEVHRVDSLFGAAFRVYYDTTVLAFAGVTEGDFLSGADDPPVSTLLFVMDTLDYVACTVTRTRAPDVTHQPPLPPGISGSGRLVTFHFAKVHAGTSDLTLGTTALLVDRYGKPVPDFSTLVLESAVARVINGVR